jgi:hypothetical protein
MMLVRETQIMFIIQQSFFFTVQSVSLSPKGILKRRGFFKPQLHHELVLGQSTINRISKDGYQAYVRTNLGSPTRNIRMKEVVGTSVQGSQVVPMATTEPQAGRRRGEVPPVPSRCLIPVQVEEVDLLGQPGAPDTGVPS